MLSINEDDDEYYQAYLHQVYQDDQALPSLSPAELDSRYEEGICPTYGELHYYSVKKLIRLMHLSDQDVFLDLGSGLGKCALQVFMQAPLKRVIGVEALEALSEQANRVVSRVKADFPSFWADERKLSMICGNFLQVDWENPTCVYTCSTCFTQPVLNAIVDRVNQTPSIKQVYSLRPLPTLQRLKLVNVYRVECSWDSSLCFEYADPMRAG